VEIIPYGLPLEVYRPIDRTLARQALDIPSHSIVLMIAAFNLSDSRKGGEKLVEALQLLHARPLTLITLGAGSPAVKIDGVQVCPLGYVDHERTKALAYSAADVFVHASLADNLPNTVMESIACGTPVVSFNVGGTPDMVRPGLTGWLADEMTSASLATSLDKACDEIKAGCNLRAACRAVAETEYGADLQASRYLSQFNSLINNK
jgi:glycosyltransferase involved in cell wall biosynthesis